MASLRCILGRRTGPKLQYTAAFLPVDHVPWPPSMSIEMPTRVSASYTPLSPPWTTSPSPFQSTQQWS